MTKPFHTYRCNSCNHIWNSSKAITIWTNKGCPKCRRKNLITLHNPKCPKCNKNLKPIIQTDRQDHYIKHWECTNPKCPILKIKHTKNGTKKTKAQA